MPQTIPVAYPQSNGRAGIVAKTAKRISYESNSTAWKTKVPLLQASNIAIHSM